MTLTQQTIPSPVGELTLVASDVGLRAVVWPTDVDRIRFESEPIDGAHPVLDVAVEQLDEYFAGRRTEFDIPLDPVGTDFQLDVWRALAEIPYGETRSYGEQADGIGRPTAVRAVGAANGRNPLSIVLPCHRVVGADGKLTGFAAGLDTKSWLLEHEQSVAGDDNRLFGREDAGEPVTPD
jgi:methylated-DNA-[protein]-cysteine S-methyltransferase